MFVIFFYERTAEMKKAYNRFYYCNTDFLSASDCER